MLIFDLIYLWILLFSFPWWMRFLWRKEYRQMLKGRFIPQIKFSSEKRIWIHAVSVGEVKSLGSLIKKLKEKYHHPIVLSVTTPTGLNYARIAFPDIQVMAAPIDFSFITKRFIRLINPAILLLNELEIWPNWILSGKKQNLPLVLINGRISEPAFKRYHIFSWFFNLFLDKMDLLLVQSPIYEKRFRHLNLPTEKIHICGSIKADEALDTAEKLSDRENIMAALNIANKKNKIVALASSHEDDEKVFIQAIRPLKNSMSFIIAPRHLDRIPYIISRLKHHGFKYSLLTKADHVDLNKEILIIDQMGLLFKVLKITDIVFMGGTFSKKIGGHNLYEPAVLGKCIVGGPFFNNFPEIADELITNGLYKIIRHPQELQDFLISVRDDHYQLNGHKAIDIVKQRRGSVECILNHLNPLIS